jgi:predicted ArsR family transcriptional regulator
MATEVTDAKRRVLDRLKRVDGATAAELAGELGLTEAAVRQHLDALETNGLVTRRERPAAGRGRPPVEWSLTAVASELFPDRHGDLTVELIDAVRAALGEEGLERVVDARAESQLASYRDELPAPDDASLARRVGALARRRSAEGYMAESRRDGDAWVLVEHHCPVCEAAEACTGLCRTELELFRTVLGPGVEVERTQHLLSGDARCAYRVTERDVSAQQ